MSAAERKAEVMARLAELGTEQIGETMDVSTERAALNEELGRLERELSEGVTGETSDGTAGQ